MKQALQQALRCDGLPLPAEFFQPRPDTYARRLLHRDPDGRYTAVVMTWGPGQGTPLHDHGRSAGAFAVVRGVLTERVFATGPSGAHETTARLGGDRLRQFGEHYVHEVTNDDDEPAVSVHVYTPALREMNTYDVRGGRLLRTGTEKAGVDW